LVELHVLYCSWSKRQWRDDDNDGGVDDPDHLINVLDEDDEDSDSEQSNDTDPDDDDNDDGGGAVEVKTRSGRVSTRHNRLIESDYGLAAHEDPYSCQLTTAEQHYYQAIGSQPDMPGEIGCVGAGLGGGFVNTKELHVMKYDAAMLTPGKPKWEESVAEEHDRMKDNEVFEVVPRKNVPVVVKILTSTWAMKKKSDGKFRAMWKSMIA
jgi:hypothetical protein